MRGLIRGIILDLIIIAMPSWMRKGIGSLLLVLGLGLTAIGLSPLIGYANGDVGWEGMVVMSPYNTKLMPASLIQEAVNMEVAIKDGTLHPFTGPIYNQAGEMVVPEGEVAPDGMLLGMNFYVQGIDGEVPQ